jgi:hypothetical protein
MLKAMIPGIVKTFKINEKVKTYLPMLPEFIEGLKSKIVLEENELDSCVMLSLKNGDLFLVPCTLSASPDSKTVINRQFEPINATEILNNTNWELMIGKFCDYKEGDDPIAIFKSCKL